MISSIRYYRKLTYNSRLHTLPLFFMARKISLEPNFRAQCRKSGIVREYVEFYC